MFKFKIMKRKITCLLFAVGTIYTANSQVILSEDFNDPFTPGVGTNEWVVINNSSPAGAVSWEQGNQTGGNGTLTAYNGSTDDFFMADFLAVSGTVGDISAFLITPTLSIYNGAELKFATRTMVFSGAALYPDRMQVLMSQTGSSVIPTGTASVGTFTDVLLDINPNLTPGTTSVVSNGTVNGYPQSWVVYTIPITNVTGTVTGRFAFRYFVQNGGSAGGNSRLIGLDAVRFTLPCGPTVQSFTTCAGVTTTLNAINGTGATTYSWNTGATTNTIAVTPTVTTVYTLTPSIGGSVTCPAVQTTLTIGGQLSMLVSSSASTVCAGTSVVLTATSSAATYSWSNGTTQVGGTGSVITVTPSTNTTYSVQGLSGACSGGSSINITVNPSPTVSAATANTLICTTGATTAVTFSAIGNGTNYAFFDLGGTYGTTSSTLSIPISTINATTNFTMGVVGISADGCLSSNFLLPYTVALKPVLTTTVTKSPSCINTVVQLYAEGADSYTWTGPGGITDNGDNLSFPTGTVTGNKTFTVIGINSEGCTTSKTMLVNVNPCLGIEKLEGDNSASHIFPNPFANQLTISGLIGKVVVYNTLGQAVMNVEVNGNDEIMNTAELPKGAYILKVYDSAGMNTKTIKLVKN